jgi:hypothetical protein
MREFNQRKNLQVYLQVKKNIKEGFSSSGVERLMWIHQVKLYS